MVYLRFGSIYSSFVVLNSFFMNIVLFFIGMNLNKQTDTYTRTTHSKLSEHWNAAAISLRLQCFHIFPPCPSTRQCRTQCLFWFDVMWARAREHTHRLLFWENKKKDRRFWLNNKIWWKWWSPERGERKMNRKLWFEKRRRVKRTNIKHSASQQGIRSVASIYGNTFASIPFEFVE